MSQEWKDVWYESFIDLFLKWVFQIVFQSAHHSSFPPQTQCQRNTNTSSPFTSLATDCLRWSYNIINETCILFGHPNKSRQQEVMEVAYETDQNYHSGFRYCGTSCYFTGRRQNVHFGNTFSRTITDSALDCQDKCQQEASCVYWYFDLPKEQCYLKWKVESGPIEKLKDYIHGEKHCSRSMGMKLACFCCWDIVKPCPKINFLAKIHVNSKEFAVTANPPATDYRVDTPNLFDHDHLEGAWTFFRSDESVQPPHS